MSKSPYAAEATGMVGVSRRKLVAVKYALWIKRNDSPLIDLKCWGTRSLILVKKHRYNGQFLTVAIVTRHSSPEC